MISIMLCFDHYFGGSACPGAAGCAASAATLVLATHRQTAAGLRAWGLQIQGHPAAPARGGSNQVILYSFSVWEFTCYGKRRGAALG